MKLQKTRSKKLSFLEKKSRKYKSRLNTHLNLLISSCINIHKKFSKNIFIRYSICSIGDLVDQIKNNNDETFIDEYYNLVLKWKNIFILLDKIYIKIHYNNENKIDVLYEEIKTEIINFKCINCLLQNRYKHNMFLLKSFNFIDYLFGKIYYDEKMDYKYFYNNLYNENFYNIYKKIIYDYEKIFFNYNEKLKIEKRIKILQNELDNGYL